jgi:uncharacterized protein YcgL (UPF0745 family)
MSLACVVYRCGKQEEMYLYLRADLSTDALPEALRHRTGKLTQAMTLDLGPERKLARVDTVKVMQQLQTAGYYLQMPPDGHIKGHLYFGD